jgi:hypothetical protein
VQTCGKRKPPRHQEFGSTLTRSEYVTAPPAGELESTPEKFTETDKTKHQNFSSHSISLNTLQRVLGRILDKSSEPSFGSAFEDMATRKTSHSALGCIENKDVFFLRPLHLAFGAWKELNNDAWDCGSTWLEVKLPRAKERLWRVKEWRPKLALRIDLCSGSIPPTAFEHSCGAGRHSLTTINHRSSYLPPPPAQTLHRSAAQLQLIYP